MIKNNNIHDSYSRSGMTDVERNERAMINDSYNTYGFASEEQYGATKNADCITICLISDEDFGFISIYYYPKQKVIVADGLTISNVPTDYDVMNIMSAWELFKRHYLDYAELSLTYEQIAEGDSLFNN